MTALGAGQIRSRLINDAPDRFGVFALLNFSSGDTVDVAPWFSSVKLAVVFATTAGKAGVGTSAGTVVTLTPTGMTNEGGYLVVYGAAAAESS